MPIRFRDALSLEHRLRSLATGRSPGDLNRGSGRTELPGYSTPRPRLAPATRATLPASDVPTRPNLLTPPIQGLNSRYLTERVKAPRMRN